MTANTHGGHGGATTRDRSPGRNWRGRSYAALAALAAVAAVLVPTVGDVGAQTGYPSNMEPGASPVPFTPVSWVLSGPPVAGSNNPGPTCFGGVYLEFNGDVYGESPVPGTAPDDYAQVWFQRPATATSGFNGAPRDPLASRTSAAPRLVPAMFQGSSVPAWFPGFFPYEFSTHAIGIFSRAAVGTVDEGCAGMERQVADYVGYASEARMWTFAFVPRNPPAAGFTWSISDRGTNEVSFTNTSSDAQDGPSELQYSWDFGDRSSTSVEKDPVHEYAEPGIYTVTLRVTDSDGDVTTTSQQVVFSTGLVVNSVGDEGAVDAAARGCDTGGTVGTAAECTLRAAIEAAVADGEGEITFDIDTPGIPAITAATPLPALSVGIAIDGTTQAGGVVAVRAPGDYGLNLTAGSSTIEGLAVAGASVAVAVTGGAAHQIRGNRLATDATGTTSDGPFGVGIRAASGVVVADNVIGGEVGVSVVETAAATELRDNAVGVTEDGGAVLGATKGGVVVAGPDTVVEGNHVAGESAGIAVLGAAASGTSISGNRVGVTASGAPLTDTGYAVRIDGAPGATVSDNTLWGSTEAVVAITGVPQYEESPDGELLFSGPSDEPLDGAATGGTATLTGNTIGTEGAIDPIVGGVAVWADASAVTVAGNTMLGATQTAVSVAGGDGHEVSANVLGTATGTVGDAVRFDDVGDSLVGGAGVGNLIVAESGGVVLTEGRGAVRVEGNAVTLSEPGPGIVTDGATPAIVGNAVTGADRAVSSPDDDAVVTDNTIGEGGSGIDLEGDDVVVQDNTLADQAGVGISSQGDRAAVRRNSVVRSTVGLRVSGDEVEVESNLVGITVAGEQEGNLGDGIDVTEGDAVLAGNQVVASAGVGIDVATDATAELRANRIWSSTGAAVRSPGGPDAPSLVAAVQSGSGETLRRTLVVTDLPTGAAGRLEVFANESCDDPEARYLMDIVRATSPDERARIIQVREAPDRDHFTVSYTDDDGNTSELSDCVSGGTFADADGDGSVDPFDGLLDPAARNDGGRAILATDTEQLLLVGVAEFDADTGTGGGVLEGLAIAEDPAPDSHPAGWDLPYGALGFRITGIEPGARTSVLMTTLWGASPILGDEYWKYGPQTPGGSSSWYAFDLEEASGTGATLSSALDVPGLGLRRAFVLQLADGLRGDADGGANGSITDPGGPVIFDGGYEPPPPTTTSTVPPTTAPPSTMPPSTVAPTTVPPTTTTLSTTTSSTVPSGAPSATVAGTSATPGASSPPPAVSGASVNRSTGTAAAATSAAATGLASTGTSTALWLLVATVLIALGLAARVLGRVRRREG